MEHYIPHSDRIYNESKTAASIASVQWLLKTNRRHIALETGSLLGISIQAHLKQPLIMPPSLARGRSLGRIFTSPSGFHELISFWRNLQGPVDIGRLNLSFIKRLFI